MNILTVSGRRIGLRSGVGLAALALATPAFAQDVEGSTDQDSAEVTDTSETAEAITVTGSRIRRPNLDSTVPVTSIQAKDLIDRGSLSLGDALAELPQLGSTFTQANSTRFIGTAGINRLDLRNLGTSRTLVLVNGRRHVTSSPGTYDVDTNTIPSDLLERVDITTGGNSAIYGSDAIAGVVNFVMKTDFEGLRLRGQAGISDEGDAGGQFLSLTAGKSFMDGRLNIAFSGEYANQDQLLNNDRDRQTGALTGTYGFVTTQPVSTFNPANRTTTNTPNRNFDGVPNTTLLSGIRFPQLNGNGMLNTVCRFLSNAAYDALTPLARAQYDAAQRLSCASTQTVDGRVIPGTFSPTGGGIAHNWSFNDAGTELIRSVPTADLRPLGGGVIGGLGSTGLEGGQLLPELQRYAGNIFINADISPAFQPFLEAKYVRVDSIQGSNQATFATGVLRANFRIDNPFLTPTARQQIVTINGLDPASPGVVNGTETFNSFRFNYDLGTRAEDHRRETYRAVLGTRGDLSTKGNLRYEVAASYGRTETYYETGGNINVANYNRATDAARNTAGQIVCRVNLVTVVDPNCAPLNPFGFGNASQAAKNYVLTTSSREQWAEQVNVVGYLSGDTDGLFRLPGGPIAFAVGAEYRSEDAYSAFDVPTATGLTFLNGGGAFDPPKQEVREIFGEVRLPLLANLPFVEELSIEGAARYSDYNTLNKGVWAYNAGIVYSPIRDVRFRAAYGRAVRAPNIGDLYSTAAETFLNGLIDPCSQTVINDNPNRTRNCAAAGVPTTLVVNGETRPWTNTPASGISGVNAGNPNLTPETSDSLTIGAVFQPSFVPGLSFSVDYYNIKVKSVISAVAPQAIINQCYDDPVSINNPFCAAQFRRSGGGEFVNATFNGQRDRVIAGIPNVNLTQVGPSFLAAPFNYAQLRARGIDFEANYTKDLAQDFNLSIRAVATYNLERTDFLFITEPARSTRLHGTLGLPIFTGNLFTTLTFKEFDLGYTALFIGKQAVNDWETDFSHQGRPPINPDATPFNYYPDIIYHNLRFGFEPEGTSFRFYAGMDNVLDQLPPQPLSGTTAGGGIFPIQGRYMYAGATVKF